MTDPISDLRAAYPGRVWLDLETGRRYCGSHPSLPLVSVCYAAAGRWAASVGAGRGHYADTPVDAVSAALEGTP